MNKRNISSLQAIYELLGKLTPKQFKIFYGILVHCRAHGKGFISKQNLFNLWCELNYHCYELDEGFPNPYDDYDLLKDFCHAHPYYFIDILPIDLIAKLFVEYCDERLDVLQNLVRILYSQGSRAAHQYILDEYGFEHTVEELETDLKEHIAIFS